MPKYISPLGVSCTVDEAKPGGFLRPGYKELLGDGDYIHFDIMMRDGAQSGGSTVFLTDSNAAIRAQVDREQAAHDAKFAFMADAAPKFDRERAEFLARNREFAKSGKEIRDMALAGRAVGTGTCFVANDRAQFIEDGASIRDIALRARFAG